MDTFYAVGLAASLCQLFSVLELYHIADGLEKARLLPRFIQVRAAARILASAALTPCLKQKKTFRWPRGAACWSWCWSWRRSGPNRWCPCSSSSGTLWNSYGSACSFRLTGNQLLMLVSSDRYPHELLSVTGTPFVTVLWLRYTLRIPVYVLSVTVEGR